MTESAMSERWNRVIRVNTAPWLLVKSRRDFSRIVGQILAFSWIFGQISNGDAMTREAGDLSATASLKPATPPCWSFQKGCHAFFVAGPAGYRQHHLWRIFALSWQIQASRQMRPVDCGRLPGLKTLLKSHYIFWKRCVMRPKTWILLR